VTDQLDDYCAANQPRFVDELIEWLRIPSISAQPEHAPDVGRNAEHLAAAARAAGFSAVEVLETAGDPAVYAERIVDPALPTVLVYGHHDVQPVDPLDEWVSPPFEPQIRDGGARREVPAGPALDQDRGHHRRARRHLHGACDRCLADG